MKSGWSEFAAWRHACDAFALAESAMANARSERLQHDAKIKDILRRHGPILHNGHVYRLSSGEIECEPCADSLNIRLDESN